MATIKKHFSYNNGVRDISLVNDLKCLSESLTEILNGEFLQKKMEAKASEGLSESTPYSEATIKH